MDVGSLMPSEVGEYLRLMNYEVSDFEFKLIMDIDRIFRKVGREVNKDKDTRNK